MRQGFNLLKPQVEAPSVWTTLYKWVVGTARVILIITETAVIIALVIRVVIDVQGKDLDEKISNYENILSVRGLEEKKYIDLQTMTADYRDSFNKEIKYSVQLGELIKNIPLTFSNIELGIINNKISLKGKGPNADVKKMEQYLKSNDLYNNTKLIAFDVGENKDPSQLSDFDFESEFKSLPNKQLITDNVDLYN